LHDVDDEEPVVKRDAGRCLGTRLKTSRNADCAATDKMPNAMTLPVKPDTVFVLASGASQVCICDFEQ